MSSTPEQLYAADQARMDYVTRDERYGDFARNRGFGKALDEAYWSMNQAELLLAEHKRWAAWAEFMKAAAAFDSIAREYRLLAMRDAEGYWREQALDASDRARGIERLTGRGRNLGVL